MSDLILSTDKYQDELRLSREILRNEMQRAIRAYTAKEKRDLLAEWKDRYSPVLAAELLRVAKDPEARVRIANWNLTAFDKERRKSK